MSAVVYRHFDAGGALLYVGMSLNFYARLMQHNYGTTWIKQVSRVEIEHFATKDDAVIAERNAIFREKPKHNKTFMSPLALAASAFDLFSMPDDEMITDVEKLRQSGQARLQYADALEAWNAARPAYAEAPSVTVAET